MSTTSLNDLRKYGEYRASEVKRLSFSSVSPGAFGYKWRVACSTAHTHTLFLSTFLPYALLESFPQPPQPSPLPSRETWALHFRSPCHRRKLPNCQHICDSLASALSQNMAVKIALLVLDHLKSNLIQASRKKKAK